jgi:hypothetical protein
MKSYISVRQVVERLNRSISVKLVYKLIAAGKLRVNRSTGKVLVEEDSLVELMEGRPRAPPVPETPPPERKQRRQKDAIKLW